MGGEKCRSWLMVAASMGSPPHGRGKAVDLGGAVPVVRITPAWAGKRSVELLLSVLSLDHPRVGREKARTLIVQDEPQGSPPRRRGKVDAGIAEIEIVGITPAWAGKSSIIGVT